MVSATDLKNPTKAGSLSRKTRKYWPRVSFERAISSEITFQKYIYAMCGTPPRLRSSCARTRIHIFRPSPIVIPHDKQTYLRLCVDGLFNKSKNVWCVAHGGVFYIFDNRNSKKQSVSVGLHGKQLYTNILPAYSYTEDNKQIYTSDRPDIHLHSFLPIVQVVLPLIICIG